MRIRITRIESNDGEYFIELKDKNKNLWGVMDFGNRMNRNGKWDYEPLPSSRTDKWIKDHSFTFKEAKEKLKKIEEEKE